jgi:hypothetical protein
MPADKAKLVGQILQGTGDAADLGEYIAPDALAVARVSMDPTKIWQKLREVMSPRQKEVLYQQLDALEKQTKINVEKDVLGLMAGRFAVAVYAPDAAALKGGLSIRRPDRLAELVPITAMIQVKDRKKSADLLSAIERALTTEGHPVRVRSEGDRRIYYVGEAEAPTMSWTVAKDVVVLATGTRLAKVLALMDKGGENVLGQVRSSRAKNAIRTPEGAVFYYDLAKTADLIRGLDLPGEIKLMLSTVTTTLGRFEDVVWTIEPESNGAMMILDVNLKK